MVVERTPRLLLVDLVNPDPFQPFCTDLYPFVLGLARRHELPARWVRVAVDAPPSDLAPRIETRVQDMVARALREHRATHAMFNVKLQAPLIDELERAAPGLRVLCVHSELSIHDPRAMWSVSDWLGQSSRLRAELAPGGHPFDLITPDYTRQNLDERTAALRTITEVYAGPECAYRPSVADNPYYARLELREPDLARGCAFCLVPDARVSHLALTPVELALRQVEAAHRTSSAGGEHEYLLGSSFVFLQMRRFFEGIERLRLPPSSFLFSCRIDELLRSAGALRELLPRLRDAGHRLAIQRIGLENFSPVENQRFNKGITSEQIDAAFALVAELEHTFPETFLFRQYGGFGFILFTPWTTLEDLRLNLRGAQRLDEGGRELLFSSQLQLRPGRPITALAQLDGLVVEEHRDHPFYSGCLHYWDDEELPWRFAHPEVALVHGVIRRLSHSADIPPGDPLRARVEATLLRLPLDCLDRLVAVDLLLAVAGAGGQPTVDELLERFVEAARTRALAADGSAEGREEPRHGPMAGVSLAAALERFSRSHPRSLRGFRVARFGASLPGMQVELERPDGRISLSLRPRRSGHRYSYRTQRYDLTFRPSAPSLDREGAALTSRIGRLIERVPASAP